MRLIFRRNIGFVSRVFVQTDAMKIATMKSYNLCSDSVVVVRHRLPDDGYSKIEPRNPSKRSDDFVFFYPASFYVHKNHKVLWDAIPSIAKLALKIRFDLTIEKEDAPPEVRESPYLHFLGKLSPKDCRDYYCEVDALFFPSMIESYGLPMLEAMYLHKVPILAADRPYARDVCGNRAFYFIVDSSLDLCNKIKEIVSDFSLRGRATDELLPELIGWDEMASQLAKLK